MQKKQNEGWDDISKEDSSRKPITAKAVKKAVAYVDAHRDELFAAADKNAADRK